MFPKREEWSAAQRQWIRDYFFRELLPVLTPIGLDPAHPFPRVFNKSLNFAVELEGRDAFGRNSGAAIVQAPRALPRVIRLPQAIAGEAEYAFVFLSSILHAHMGELFAGMNVRGLLPVPRHAQFRPVRRRGGDQEPAHRAAGRALPPPLRRRGAPGSGRQLLAAHGGVPAAAVQPARRRPLPRRRPGQPLPPARSARPGGAPRPQVPAVPARPAAGARHRRHLRGAEEAGRAAAPPVPVVPAGDRLHPHHGERPAT